MHGINRFVDDGDAIAQMSRGRTVSKEQPTVIRDMFVSTSDASRST